MNSIYFFLYKNNVLKKLICTNTGVDWENPKEFSNRLYDTLVVKYKLDSFVSIQLINRKTSSENQMEGNWRSFEVKGFRKIKLYFSLQTLSIIVREYEINLQTRVTESSIDR